MQQNTGTVKQNTGTVLNLPVATTEYRYAGMHGKHVRAAARLHACNRARDRSAASVRGSEREKMAVLLMLKMAAAIVTLHSGYRHYIDRTTAQIPTRSRRTESTTWCGSQTPALSFPHMRISPAPLAPLLAISLALLCAAGQFCMYGNGAK